MIKPIVRSHIYEIETYQYINQRTRHTDAESII